MTDLLTERALNRALLERQSLLRRSTLSVPELVEHLVGMQAQAPLAPYVGLWSRLEGFRAESLSELLTERQVVRATAMLRTTIHLLSARDCLLMRPILQAVQERAFASSPFAPNLAGMEMDELVAAGREVLDERPRTGAELARMLGARWPDRDATSLSYAVRFLLPTVQVPPRGIWGANGPPALAAVESWLGQPLARETAPDALVMRYLAAFGPATAADVAAWSWLTGMREVVARLRPLLRTFKDERGRELFDLPDAPRPEPGTPAPPRFLPEYDNAVLSHADRARIIPAGRRVPLPPGNGGAVGTVLVDGFLRGTWRIVRQGNEASLVVEPWEPLSAADEVGVAAEGHALLGFAAAEATGHTVRFSASR